MAAAFPVAMIRPEVIIASTRAVAELLSCCVIGIAAAKQGVLSPANVKALSKVRLFACLFCLFVCVYVCLWVCVYCVCMSVCLFVMGTRNDKRGLCKHTEPLHRTKIPDILLL